MALKGLQEQRKVQRFRGRADMSEGYSYEGSTGYYGQWDEQWNWCEGEYGNQELGNAWKSHKKP